jgi:glycosyltransferase involved in cell wall biosynthesis
MTPSEGPLVHGVTWLTGRFGYNIHARNFFGQLGRRLPVTVTPLVMLDGPLAADQEILRRDFPDWPTVSIALLYGCFAEQVLRSAPGPRVAYTVWESTRLPDDWIEPLRAMDQVWVPSEWGRTVMIENGIPAERMRVVPEGVDPAVFNPGVAPAEAIAARPGFKFLNIGRFETRKGSRELIRTFDRTFQADEAVSLVMACDNPHDPDFDLRAELRSLNLRHPEKLAFVPPVVRQTTLAALYGACDAFVSPHRAEGWGLPIIEAMACGLPVIATDYSGPQTFLGPHAYRLGYEMAPIEEPFFEAADGNHGMWAEPDWAMLGDLMREVYETQAAAADRGARGGANVREAFSWARAADLAVPLIRELVER